MLRLATAHKLQILRGIRQVLLAGRSAIGRRDHQVEVTRNGLRWNLDLDQGIDLSIYLLGRFEPVTAHVLNRSLAPGMVVVDIGANIGAHALPMAKAVGPTGRVYAIEPTDWAFDKLTRNAELNPGLSPQLVRIQALLSDGAAAVPDAIYSAWEVGGPAGDRHPIHGGTAHRLSGARAVTLDALLAERGVTRVDLIKLDVDGFECAVLRGAAQTLTRHGPKIVFELAPYALTEQGASLAELLRILLDHGYRFETQLFSRALPRTVDELAALVPDAGSRNIIAVR